MRAVDAGGNVDTTPASYSWYVDVPPDTGTGTSTGGPPGTAGVDTTAPNFALAPTEEYLTGALARGLTVLAGCASACKVSATLTIAARKARSLGLRQLHVGEHHGATHGREPEGCDSAASACRQGRAAG